MDLFFSHFPISSLLNPSRKRKSVLHVLVADLLILSDLDPQSISCPTPFHLRNSRSLTLPLLPSTPAASIGYGDTTRVQSNASLLLLLLSVVWPIPPVSGRRCVRCSSTLIVRPCPLSAPRTSSEQSDHPTFCRRPTLLVPPPLVCQLGR